MFRDERRKLWLNLFLVFVLWLTICFTGIYTAAKIWYSNEIFNHGFFVLPGSLYLIYLKRRDLLSQPINPALLPVVLILPALLVYVAGFAGDIQLLLHLATFSLFPLLIWSVIGHRAAWQIFFPLCFIMFSVPIGEQLIPYLQQITADGSVYLLKLSGIPLFRTGLYIEIPQGRFLVAEACSGVSFFIASLVIGSLYAYLNFKSSQKRILFTLISIFLPVLANIVRVYGIILVAYWSDMEHAAGADHIIYGWFFFAFVICCLLGLGELLREKSENDSAHKPNVIENTSQYSAIRLWVIYTILIATVVWLYWISVYITKPTEMKQGIPFLQDVGELDCNSGFEWSPNFNKPSTTLMQYIGNPNRCDAQYYQAWFDEIDNELVSDLNKLYDEKSWSLVRNEAPVKLASGVEVSVRIIISPAGQERKVAYWFQIGEFIFGSPVKAKLYQTFTVMKGGNNTGVIHVVSLPVNSDMAAQVEKLSCSLPSKCN
ncbi:MAG: EpsI family protein [Alteromonas sp.]|nr:MAG: EpsI family protein [Alteromonas sp.]